MTDSLKVLVVEHDAAAARVLEAMCAQQGWACAVAADVSAALLSARKSPPDAVVLDTRLPSGGALITLKRLRAAAETAAAPVVLVGAAAGAAIDALLAAGAQAHVADPADAAGLQAALRPAVAEAPVPAQAPAEILRHPLRMAALRASGLLDSPPAAGFDRVTRLVARLLGAPTALLSLVDKDRQFFKSAIGLGEPWASARQTPLSHSFCQWVVSGREMVSVSDAREHRLLRHNQALHDLGVVAYAGVPVQSLQGDALGSLCAIDAQPRDWTAEDAATLRDLASVTEASIAYDMLVRQPPSSAEELDHYIEASGSAISGAVSVLRREGPRLAREDREDLLALIEEHAAHLVQLNRLIQVHQATR